MLESTTARVVEALTARAPVARLRRWVLYPLWAQMAVVSRPKTTALRKHSRTPAQPHA
jgi:hypothetical protein